MARPGVQAAAAAWALAVVVAVPVGTGGLARAQTASAPLRRPPATVAVFFSSSGSANQSSAGAARTFQSGGSGPTTAPSGPNAPPAPAPPSPGQSPSPAPSPGLTMSPQEQEMLRMVNQARRQAAVPPVTPDQRLNQVAWRKAQDILKNGYWSHYSPTYGSPADMVRAAGVAFSWVGENLARAPDVAQAFQGLMNSPNHRANILYPHHRLVGLAVAEYQQWGRRWVLVVQEFVTPPGAR